MTTEQKLRIKTCKQTGGTNLNMKNCELLLVPKQLLKMKGLEKINFTQNRLTEIPMDVVGLRNLKELDVSWNNIISLTVLFSQLQLTKLNLSGNQIKELPDLNPGLQVLDLSSNQLKEISSTFVTSIRKSLRELSLSLNQISSLAVFDGLDNLEVLNLSSNNISSIPKLSMASLQNLNLSKNQLKVNSATG